MSNNQKKNKKIKQNKVEKATSKNKKIEASILIRPVRTVNQLAGMVKKNKNNGRYKQKTLDRKT